MPHRAMRIVTATNRVTGEPNFGDGEAIGNASSLRELAQVLGLDAEIVTMLGELEPPSGPIPEDDVRKIVKGVQDGRNRGDAVQIVWRRSDDHEYDVKVFGLEHEPDGVPGLVSIVVTSPPLDEQ